MTSILDHQPLQEKYGPCLSGPISKQGVQWALGSNYFCESLVDVFGFRRTAPVTHRTHQRPAPPDIPRKSGSPAKPLLGSVFPGLSKNEFGGNEGHLHLQDSPVIFVFNCNASGAIRGSWSTSCVLPARYRSTIQPLVHAFVALSFPARWTVEWRLEGACVWLGVHRWRSHCNQHSPQVR